MAQKSVNASHRVALSRIEHRGKKRILLSFSYDETLIALVKTLSGRKYSKTYKGWYLPYDYDSLALLDELNIEMAIKEGYQEDPLFQKFESEFREDFKNSKKDGSRDKKIRFLIESLEGKERDLIKNYIRYMCSEGYSWNSIQLFSKYAIKYLSGDLERFHSGDTSVFRKRVYDRILKSFLEFRKSV